MKLREKIFLIELLVFMFFAFGIGGNIDLCIDTPIRCYIELFISMSLTFLQMFYIENCERKEEEYVRKMATDVRRTKKRN